MIRTSEMFSFLPVVNNSITIIKSFLLISTLAIISSKAIYILRFLFGFYSLIFLRISSISFEYSIKALESLKCFKSVLSRLIIKNCYFALNGSLACK